MADEEDKEVKMPERLAAKVRAIAEREAAADERAGPVVRGQRRDRPPRAYMGGAI
jgi:hypothetical protein